MQAAEGQGREGLRACSSPEAGGKAVVVEVPQHLPLCNTLSLDVPLANGTGLSGSMGLMSTHRFATSPVLCPHALCPCTNSESPPP